MLYALFFFFFCVREREYADSVVVRRERVKRACEKGYCVVCREVNTGEKDTDEKKALSCREKEYT